MAQVPIWLLGRNVTGCTATVQTVDASGNLGDSSGADVAALIDTNLTISGLLDELEYTGTKLTENISSVNQTKSNAVPISRRDSFVLTEILRVGRTGAGPFVGNCLLANLWTSATSRYVKLVFTRGGNSWSFYGTMTGYVESIRRGKSVGRMTLEMIDPGITNAAYS